MDIKKSMAIAAASAVAFTSAFAESNEDYIKTFGMIAFQNGGLKELQLTPAEKLIAKAIVLKSFLRTKNAANAPIAVEAPATNVIVNAKSALLSILR